MKSKYHIMVLCVVGGCLLAALFGRHEWRHIETASDSAGYHLIAVNLLLGKGYYQYIFGSLDDYDAETIKRFSTNRVLERHTPSMGRTPGYPLFLLGIYKLHGVNPDIVIRYQIALMGLVGGLLVLAGWFIAGKPGAWLGFGAVFLLGMNREASYPTSLLLTECLAMFLLTAAFTAAAWAKCGGWKRELVVSVLIGLAILTRPGLVFVGIIYGIIILLQCIKADWKRVLAFVIPCGVLLISWSLFASLQSGHFIPLVGNGPVNIAVGLDPVGTAKLIGLPPPELTPNALQSFWRSFPGGVHRDIGVLISEIPGRWQEVIQINMIKLKTATDWLTKPLFICILLGFSLLGTIKVLPLTQDTIEEKTHLFLLPTGSVYSKKLIDILYLIAFGLLALVILGYSQTLIIIFFLILPFISFFVKAENKIDGYRQCAKMSGAHQWVLSWYIGFILMTIVSFGIPRFMRPYLPVFYLCAVFSIPLLLTVLMGVRNGGVKLGFRHIYFEFIDR